MDSVKEHEFSPCIITRGSEPVEFSVLPLTMYRDLQQTPCDTVSQMLESYYAARNAVTRIRQKSADLRRIVQTALDRERKI